MGKVNQKRPNARLFQTTGGGHDYFNYPTLKKESIAPSEGENQDSRNAESRCNLWSPNPKERGGKEIKPLSNAFQNTGILEGGKRLERAGGSCISFVSVVWQGKIKKRRLRRGGK